MGDKLAEKLEARIYAHSSTPTIASTENLPQEKGGFLWTTLELKKCILLMFVNGHLEVR